MVNIVDVVNAIYGDKVKLVFVYIFLSSLMSSFHPLDIVGRET